MNPQTLPDAGTWAHFRGQEFLVSGTAACIPRERRAERWTGLGASCAAHAATQSRVVSLALELKTEQHTFW